MTTITGLTAERMLAIEAASVVDGDIVGDNLILTQRGGTKIDAGNVRGPVGPGFDEIFPPGIPFPWLPPDASPPDGWIEFMGQVIPNDCPMLAEIYGLVLPDLRGRVLMGYTMAANQATHPNPIAVGSLVGEATHLNTAAESGLPAHSTAATNHSTTATTVGLVAHNHAINAPSGYYVGFTDSAAQAQMYMTAGSGKGLYAFNPTISNSGAYNQSIPALSHSIPALSQTAENAVEPHNTVQPSYACRWITRAV